jgi:hypothetical protein
MVGDSYVKFIDRFSEEPIQSVKMRWGDQVRFTNNVGIIPVFNRWNESLIFTAEHREYFIHEESATLGAGDTLIVELTKLLAGIEFQVKDETGPVPNLSVNLTVFSTKTDSDGIALFFNKPARRVYHYSIEKPCYFLVYDSLFLEIDTMIHITLEKDTILPVVTVETYGDTLQINSSKTGDLYAALPGTEPQPDSIHANSILSIPVTSNDMIQVITSDLPFGDYWVYVIDDCGNISEGLTIRVGFEEFPVIPFRIYPNPVGNALFIEPTRIFNFSVDISSVNGRILYSRVCSGSRQYLDLSSFPKGVYFITIRSKDFVSTRKIIKL